MSERKQNLQEWMESLREFHIPRWNELPEIDLYADQVVIYIEKYLMNLFGKENKFITASMIHNYAKLKLMPKPNKKRYSRMHVAYLLTITILKQVLAISEIKDGILSQAHKTNNGYDLFCEELEMSIEAMYAEISGIPYEKKGLENDSIAVRMAAYAFVSKMTALNAIRFQREGNENE